VPRPVQQSSGQPENSSALHQPARANHAPAPARRLARRLLNPWLVKNPRELLTAGLGGVFGTGVDLGILVLLVSHHVPIPLATFIGSLSGAVTNFTLNKYVAFRDRSPISLGQIVRYDFVAVVTALLMAAAMKIATAAYPGLPVMVAKLACAAILFAIWTYPAQRHLVFARSAEAV
jgi:putative flippase GtrA